jgi:hypothetical protein
MEISPAAGKILGMLMAYGVSALGLLLAYYNYRKRIVKADEIFSPVARRILIGVISAFIVIAILAAAAVGNKGQTPLEALRQNWIGILLPAAIFAISFWLTWLLYRHFARGGKK